MTQYLPAKKKQESLPKAQEPKLLSKPTSRVAPLAALALVPIVFVLIYALSPWFAIPEGIVNGVMIGVTFLFIGGVVYLMVMTVFFLYYLTHQMFAKSARVESHIKLTLFMLMSLMFLPVLVHLVQIE